MDWRANHAIRQGKPMKKTFKQYYQEKKEYIKERQRQYRRRCKEETVLEYGGRCSCCGERKIEFLTIEHINQDGAKHRREIGGSCRMHQWLKKNNYPDGYTILCFNCNAASFYYGKCPHKKSFRLSSGSEKE